MAVERGDVDEWDKIPDDELEETLMERIYGLREMFPQSFRDSVSSTISMSIWGAQYGFYLVKNAAWIAATTSLIMFLPYIIEKERSDLGKSQVAQQQQLLLGPSAALSAAKN
ncbi:hypothetical protein AB6A40_007408 [Gnathostoma spinigerum]|uniref:Mitochondrial import receptor subunit TOM22 homolog n=1 Tax=Gnathostoma spinigerum TaxID=75299 RepID=A0ABD6EL54_9BILA